jgi:hypothetical protein
VEEDAERRGRERGRGQRSKGRGYSSEGGGTSQPGLRSSRSRAVRPSGRRRITKGVTIKVAGCEAGHGSRQKRKEEEYSENGYFAAQCVRPARS